mmetsp:Transcript_5712/g.8542  ORF Transcript_5712/g.8542 Transcript_5712/m.8542 type:complete len:82 (-) Transcript_5712:1262-1507(-)
MALSKSFTTKGLFRGTHPPPGVLSFKLNSLPAGMVRSVHSGGSSNQHMSSSLESVQFCVLGFTFVVPTDTQLSVCTTVPNF